MKLKPINCGKCSRHLCDRGPRHFEKGGIKFPLKRSQPIECQCGQITIVAVDRKTTTSSAA